MPVTARLRFHKQPRHQFRAADPVGPDLATEPQQPSQRHAVRRHHPGFVMNALQLGRALAFHHAVHTGDADIVPLTSVHPLTNSVYGGLHVDGADADPQHVFP